MFVFGENPSVPPKKWLELHKLSNNTEYKLYIFKKGILFYKCQHETIKQRFLKSKIKKKKRAKNYHLQGHPKPQDLWVNLIKGVQASPETEIV